jgi:hypothetical protein
MTIPEILAICDAKPIKTTNTLISDLVNSSPDTLNTLNELAAAINDDANFSTTITNALANKVNTSLALFKPGSTVSPTANGDLVLEATSNTSITVKFKGSDGVVRSSVLTLT